MTDQPSPEPAPEPALGADADDDPEIAALLNFAPVLRRNKRRDGWSPERQRGFIAALARCGSVGRAAATVGRTYDGAYKLRSAGGAEQFNQAWDAAIDLYLARNPTLPRTGRGRTCPAPPPPPAPPSEPEPDEDALWEALCDSIFMKYLQKLDAEREARLAGRIVEADLYVRQLTWLEVSLDLADLGERAIEMFKALERGGRHPIRITATPVSLVLDQLRRAYWEREGGPERPPLAPLGDHDDEAASGQPLECQHWPERDGPGFGGSAQSGEDRRSNAEAQRAWEEKARTDAAEWKERERETQG